jgi:hypothetical protein
LRILRKAVEFREALFQNQIPQNESVRLNLIAQAKIVNNSTRLSFKANRRWRFVRVRLPRLPGKIALPIRFLRRSHALVKISLSRMIDWYRHAILSLFLCYGLHLRFLSADNSASPFCMAY